MIFARFGDGAHLVMVDFAIPLGIDDLPHAHGPIP